MTETEEKYKFTYHTFKVGDILRYRKKETEYYSGLYLVTGMNIEKYYRENKGVYEITYNLYSLKHHRLCNGMMGYSFHRIYPYKHENNDLSRELLFNTLHNSHSIPIEEREEWLTIGEIESLVEEYN